MGFVALGLLNGISFGIILFLLTTGLSLTLGLMGIVNLSHGAFYMLGSFVGWTIAVQLKLNYGLAVLGGIAAAALVGLAIERGFLQHLHKRINEQVLLTIGFIYIIMNVSLWIWGGRGRLAFYPTFLASSISIAGMQYPIYRLFTIGVGIVLAFLLWWLLERTKLGATIRAGMDDKEMAFGLGINLGRLNALVFSLGAGIAGFAGVMGSQMIGPRLGLSWDILLIALIVLVVGGIGSIQGALVGAMVIGIVDSFGKAVFPDFARFFMYLVMIIVLVVRPVGLMPRRVK